MKKQKPTNQSKKQPKYRSVKQTILAITTLPLLLACITITFFASWTLDKGLRNQIFVGLQSAATGALLSLDNVSSESFRLVDGELYKGDFNVSQNMGGLDYYAESNGVELSFFYGSSRVASTIKDKNGNRIFGNADSEITSAVLNKGETYSTTNVLIDGEYFYGYYMPIKDLSSNKVIGMVFAGRPRASVTNYILMRIFFIAIIAALNYISCVIMSTLVTRKRFIKPLAELTEASKQLAKGNIDFHIQKTSNDEFGNLAECFMSLVENTGKQARIAEKMADGDLTITYNPISSDDVMGHAIRKMIKDNNRNLTVISQATERMTAGVNEIATASNTLAQGTTEQASAIEEITASIEGIAAIAEVNAHDASTANTLVMNTRDEAVHSNEQMQQMMAAMQDINHSAGNISKIMKLIDDIASQTNIISLNASVEAARAGVHGKGFAVVAQEIRELASKSAGAAKNSAELVEDSIRKAEIGSKLAAETAASLGQILTSVENMTSLVNSIAEASGNQSSSVNQINAGITQIADVLQNNSATSEECAATSSELSNLAMQLKSAVARYRI